MSDTRPAQKKSDRHRKTECRKGQHRFGPNQSIGAGITRRVCDICSAVTIDLTGSYELAYPVVAPEDPNSEIDDLP